MAVHKIDTDKCIGCGQCVEICLNQCLDMVDGVCVWAKPELCEDCGLCESICEHGAIIINEEEKKE